MDLVTFFNSISSTIEVIVEEVVEEFLRKIQENVANNDPDGELDDLKVGNYNFTDLARTVSVTLYIERKKQNKVSDKKMLANLQERHLHASIF